MITSISTSTTKELGKWITEKISELSFFLAPQGSARRALYEKKLKPYPNLDMAKLGVAKSVDMVVTGDSTAIFTNMAQIRDLPQYPCRIIDVADSSVQFYVETSIPIYMVIQ